MRLYDFSAEEADALVAEAVSEAVRTRRAAGKNMSTSDTFQASLLFTSHAQPVQAVCSSTSRTSSPTWATHVSSTSQSKLSAWSRVKPPVTLLRKRMHRTIFQISILFFLLSIQNINMAFQFFVFAFLLLSFYFWAFWLPISRSSLPKARTCLPISTNCHYCSCVTAVAAVAAVAAIKKECIICFLMFCLCLFYSLFCWA